MSLTQKLLAGALALGGWLFFGVTVSAQQPFDISATVNPTNSVVKTTITYTINITNVSGFQRNNVYVTNAFSGAAITTFASMVNSASNTLAGEILTNNVSVIFRISNFIFPEVVRLTLSVTPQNTGQFTNRITATFPGSVSNATASVVSTVTPPISDLAVGMTNQASGVLVGDPTVIGLSVTNLGPLAATGVILSNTLPTSFNLLSISPTNSYTFNNGILVLSLGALTNGAVRQFQVSVQPTNAITNFDLIASVFAPNIQDTNTANSTVTNVMTISDFLSTNLVVNEISQQFNRQTGLREMQVQLSNVGTNDVPAARVIASGLANGTWLYNAVGTNSGAAYVLYNTNLAAGANALLRLEFYVVDRTTLTNRTLSAVGVPAINLTAPTNSSGVIITNPVMSSGGFLIEFTATPGKTYTIVYAGDVSFSNALTAQPAIVAPANRVQWIDNGPPKTISHPLNTTSRVYRVFQSQ